jgi:hypothetical protein
LVRAFRAAGVPVFVARTWPGKGRAFERKLKRQKNAARLCPACRPAPWELPVEDLDELAEERVADLAVERALEDRHWAPF